MSSQLTHDLQLGAMRVLVTTIIRRTPLTTHEIAITLPTRVIHSNIVPSIAPKFVHGAPNPRGVRVPYHHNACTACVRYHTCAFCIAHCMFFFLQYCFLRLCYKYSSTFLRFDTDATSQKSSPPTSSPCRMFIFF